MSVLGKAMSVMGKAMSVMGKTPYKGIGVFPSTLMLRMSVKTKLRPSGEGRRPSENIKTYIPVSHSFLKSQKYSNFIDRLSATTILLRR